MAGEALIFSGLGLPAVSRPIENLSNAAAPWRVPSKEELIQAYLQQSINKDKWAEFIKAEGITITTEQLDDIQPFGFRLGLLDIDNKKWDTYRNPWLSVLKTETWMPTLEELLVLYNRQYITDKTLDHYLKRLHMHSPDLRYVVGKLRHVIPPINDLIHFQIREAFTPSIVEKFGHQNEFPNKVREWAEKQGLGMDLGFKIPKGYDDEGSPLPDRNATWIDLYHWSHWRMPSLTEGYEMLHRLYDEVHPEYGPNPFMTESNKTNRDLVKLLIKTNDLSPFWRDRLIDISYRPLTRVDTRRMYEDGILGDKDVYHAIRSWGMNQINAEHLLAWYKKRKADKQGSIKRKKLIGQVCTQYTMGLMNKEIADRTLADFGMTKEERLWFLLECDWGNKITRIKKVIDTIHRGYMGGSLTESSVKGLLTKLGVNEIKIDEMMNDWQLERNADSVIATKAQLQLWFENGIMNETEVVNRLFNMNVEPVDVTRMIQMSKLKMGLVSKKQQEKEAKAAVKILREEEKEKRQEQTEAIKVVQQGKKLLKEKEDTFNRIFNEPHLKKWFQIGLVDKIDVVDILTAKGWDQLNIERWIVSVKPSPMDNGE